MKCILPLLVASLLSGCVETVWVRSDGQSAKNNPALNQQFQIDQQICNGEVSKAEMSSVPTIVSGDYYNHAVASQGVAKGCMAQHGYMLVAKKDAADYAARARATASAREKFAGK